jgi:hypothetical protein
MMVMMMIMVTDGDRDGFVRSDSYYLLLFFISDLR